MGFSFGPLAYGFLLLLGLVHVFCNGYLVCAS
jgi:hypothetical protein